MLSAILHGKKTGTGLAGLRLKIGETVGAEDILTSSVFERIAYLPDEVFCHFVNELCPAETEIGALQDLYFWETWFWQNGRVEPDVVLISQNQQTIIVENKRHDFNQQQYPKQLARQIMAAHANEICAPILLTVGGLADYSPASCQNLQQQVAAELKQCGFSHAYQMHSVSWQTLYACLDRAVQAFGNPAFLQRLLSDIRAAYDWHGIRHQPCQWLNEMPKYHITRQHFPSMVSIHESKKMLMDLKPVHLKHQQFPAFLFESEK